MNILVSACLLGINCRYDGSGTADDKVMQLLEKHHCIPICPEQMGGLSTPRLPAELQGNQVKTVCGEDVTQAFINGAEEVAKLATLFKCTYAILKERSPSCGYGQVYDGSFSGQLIEGSGLTAKRLEAMGLTILGETKVDALLTE